MPTKGTIDATGYDLYTVKDDYICNEIGQRQKLLRDNSNDIYSEC